MRVAPAITLSEDERKSLVQLSRGQRTSVRLAFRARVVLLAANGMHNDAIATELKTTPRAVGKWRRRYLERGLAGIEKDAPRGGRPKKATPALVAEVVRLTMEDKPAHATHWSTRTMARKVGVSEKTVRRIWHEHGLKPHRFRSFKLSNDPRFVEKLEDVVGLYLNPPEHAIVLSADEKSQIQALDRTQPSLPMKRGRAGTITHDYKRYGTTTLFAALNVLDGKVVSTCLPRNRHQEWLRFLKLLDSSVPAAVALHLICDNLATHKHPTVRAWLSKHPRIHVHFTPTSASWLNMVERFFRDLTANRIRRGSFGSVPELESAIQSYIDHHNEHPKPFIWTAKASDILEKVKRARTVLNKVPTA